MTRGRTTAQLEFNMSSAKQECVLAAIRHFPGKAADIEALARKSEKFRDICDELAAAEEALSAVDRLDEALRGERRLEWLGFIRRALEEIEGELRRVNVVPIARSGRRDG
jgi:hypothetical protein